MRNVSRVKVQPMTRRPRVDLGILAVVKEENARSGSTPKAKSSIALFSCTLVLLYAIIPGTGRCGVISVVFEECRTRPRSLETKEGAAYGETLM